MSNNNYQSWSWRGFPTAYQACGGEGKAVIFIHGFGASSGHWRKNISILGSTFRCYALDLIGFGASAKPMPTKEMDYTIETWAGQVADFCREVVGSSAFLIGNSIGCIVAMQAALDNPELVEGIAAINCSLRLLHERKRKALPWYRNFGAAVLQKILQNKLIGSLFYRQIARPKVIKNILLQAYQKPEAVSDELVELIFKPSQDAGAVEVFLAFTAYSSGPLAEDLLPLLSCPVILLWGTQDPWEPVQMGQELAKIPTVQEFIPLEGLGHCPQDEAPEIVNPILQEWIQRISCQQFLLEKKKCNL